MSNIDSSIKDSANEVAVLNVLMYMDIEDVKVENKDPVEEIVNRLGEIYDSPGGYERYLSLHSDGSKSDYEDRQRQYQILKNACERNPHLANMVMNDHTMFIPETSYDEHGLEACTFSDQNGNVIVAYRGTGKGEWMDNAVGVGGMVTDSPQQEEAALYFTYVALKNGFKKDMNIIVTGHSKGGNKAQYVTINSKYNDLIDKCFSFDGQGMSPEAIEAFINRHGKDAYIAAINKMYGFYEENDYVNPLAIPVIPKERRYYFKSNIINGIGDAVKFHYPDAYLNVDGSFTELGERGALSMLIERYSYDLVELPPELRIYAASGLMALMQKGTNPVNGEKVFSKGNILALALIDIPVLVDDLIHTPEGMMVMHQLAGLLGKDIYKALDKVGEEYGIPGVIVATILMVLIIACAIIIIAPLVLVLGFVGDFVKTLIKLQSILVNLHEVAKELCGIIINAINNFVNGLKQWVKENLNPGYKYAMANPVIKVDTYKLRSYADRLEQVNRRISNIDSELDSLYTKVGLKNLKDLIQADFFTDYSYRIDQCRRYLIATAEDFEQIESQIQNQINFA